MIKLSTICISLLVLISQSSLADTEFQDSIPIETVEALFNTYNENQFAVYSDIAEEFPNFTVPTDFTVVGSVFQLTNLRVVFKTELNEVDALQSIIEAFQAQDWIKFPEFSPPTLQVGFIAPQQINISRSQILCHDDLGNMTIRYSPRVSGNFLSAGISLVNSNQQGNCEQQLALQQASYGQVSQSVGLWQYLPRMEIPESQNRPRWASYIMGGSSSNGNSIDTDAAMRSEQNLEEVYNFFKEQIEEQGWELDSEVAGTLAANGTWTKAPEQDLKLIGRLSVLDSGDSNYELQFNLTAEGFTRNNSDIFSPLVR